MPEKIREMDTEEWKRKVEADARREKFGSATGGGPVSPRSSSTGHEFTVEEKVKIVTDARNDTGIAKRA